MKKKRLILLILLTFFVTGCTKYVTDDNKKRVINEDTGQSLTSNILCKPESEALNNIYKKYSSQLELKMDKLPECKNIKIYDSKSYDGIWVQLFVMPLAWVIIKIGNIFNNYGIAVMLVGLIIRIILMPLSIKMTKQSEKMKQIQPEIQKLEKKYKDKTDKDSTMQKSQEMMILYKKYNVSPMSSCLLSFIQLPLFFAFFEAINRIPAIFEGYLGAYQLGTTPLVGLKSSNYYYILLIILIILTTYLSFKNSMNNTAGGTDQQKQMKFMTGFMVVFIGIASFSLPTAIALYWIVTNGFNIVQNMFINKRRS